MNKNKAITSILNYQGETFLYIKTGNKIIVVQGKTRGIAKCHPDDIAKGLFDVDLGRRIAIARLKKKKARRKARFLAREVEKAKRQAELMKKIAAAKALKAINELDESVQKIDVLMEKVNERCKIQAKKTNNILL